MEISAHEPLGEGDDDSPPTVTVSGARPVASSPSLLASGSPPGSVTSQAALANDEVASVLHAEEVVRARGFSTIVMLLTMSALAFVPVLPGSFGRKLCFVLGLLVLWCTALWVWSRARVAARYTPRVFSVFGYVAATVSLELVYFLGVFSATPLVVTLGITFFGMGIDQKQAMRIPIYAVFGYFTLGSLMTFGVLEDHGVVSSSHMSVPTRLFFVVMAPLVLAVTLWFARVSRSSMAQAIKQAAEATRLAGQRAAQLAELHRDFEQVLRAGVGQIGRLSGLKAGCYELAEIIGHGAMGEVYAADDRERGVRAAIKLLRIDTCEASENRARFLREGEIAHKLDVPNVVKVYGTGFLESGLPYIAMELLEGEDLAALLRRSGPLETSAVIDLLDQIAAGLDAAHAVGIVHRDVKPQNLFCSRTRPEAEGIWKILDFGVSTLAGSSGTLTQAGLVGTPGYMAPEQALGKPTDARTDVFSLGAVAYRAITGRPPFAGSDTPQMLFEIVYRTPSRPSALVEGLHRDVDRVLALALAKTASARIASAGELARALAAAFAGELDRSLRRRADELISSYPWDTEASV